LKILALDASTQALSVAVLDTVAGDAAREYFEIAPRAHAAKLLTTAQQLLDESGWRLAELDGLAFGRGPGAFTGLRIAAGFIQGLAYGSELPVAPVSTLAALASRALDAYEGDHVRVVQDARMGEIYTADYSRMATGPQALNVERVIVPADLEPIADATGWLYAGNGWDVVAASGGTRPPVCVQWPHALNIAYLGAAMLARGEGVPAQQALPVYVRDDVARKPASPTN